MIIINQLLHRLDEVCRIGKSGVRHGCTVWRKGAGKELWYDYQ